VTAQLLGSFTEEIIARNAAAKIATAAEIITAIGEGR
jgi:hypothetical protein